MRWPASSYSDPTRPTVAFRSTTVLLVLAWLCLTGWVVTKTTLFGSPDEAMNHQFMEVTATTGSLIHQSGLEQAELATLRLRSVVVRGTNTLPGSFLGYVQVGGVVMRIFGTGAERMLAPLLALVGLFALFHVFRRFWGRWWCLLGVTLLAVHPAFFTYAVLPYLHNGAFVSMLLVAGWGLLRVLERATAVNTLLFGGAYGAALFFRPVEVIWTSPLVVVLLLARGLWRQLLLSGAVTIAIQLPWLMANRSVYGSFLSSGYTPAGLFDDTSGTGVVTQSAQRIFTPVGGQWSWHWLSSTWWYLILLVPTWSIAAAIALGRYGRRKFVVWNKVAKLSTLALIGVFPLVYYGSWDLFPTTPSADVGVYASYVRYWLPLYVAMTPAVVILLRMIGRRWIVAVVSLTMVAAQLSAVWTHPVAGLRAKFAADRRARLVRQTVLDATPTNAVIFAGRHDKDLQDVRLAGFLLPKTSADWRTLADMTKGRPVYVYVAVGEYNLDAIRTAVEPVGLTIAQRAAIGRDGLWQFIPHT